MGRHYCTRHLVAHWHEHVPMSLPCLVLSAVLSCSCLGLRHYEDLRVGRHLGGPHFVACCACSLSNAELQRLGEQLCIAHT